LVITSEGFHLAHEVEVLEGNTSDRTALRRLKEIESSYGRHGGYG
jgi:hypothetical protein